MEQCRIYGNFQAITAAAENRAHQATWESMN